MSVVLPPPDGDDTMKRIPRRAPLIRRSGPARGSSRSRPSCRGSRASSWRSRLFEPSVFSSRRISCVRKSSVLPTGPVALPRMPSNWSRWPCEPLELLGDVGRGPRRAPPPARGGPDRAGRPAKSARTRSRRVAARLRAISSRRAARPDAFPRRKAIRGARSAAIAPPSVSRMATSAAAASSRERLDGRDLLGRERSVGASRRRRPGESSRRSRDRELSLDRILRRRAAVMRASSACEQALVHA